MTDQPYIQVYCPACGEATKLDDATLILGPGYAHIVTCQHCETVWRIEVEFSEIENDA